MHTMQHTPGFVERFDVFRTEILGRLDPADKKKHAATHAAMDELLDPAVGLENFVIPDMSIPNTRAGLYVYLNAAVGILVSSPLPPPLPVSSLTRGHHLLTPGTARGAAGD